MPNDVKFISVIIRRHLASNRLAIIVIAGTDYVVVWVKRHFLHTHPVGENRISVIPVCAENVKSDVIIILSHYSVNMRINYPSTKVRKQQQQLIPPMFGKNMADGT